MSKLPHEDQSLGLVFAGRRLELARSPELCLSIRNAEGSKLKTVLVKLIGEVSPSLQKHFTLTWKGDWTLEVADSQRRNLTTLQITAPSNSRLAFDFLQLGGVRK